ncbi:MAG: MmcQ/YjbR family DNA-binding protein [Bacteroidia bacterium]|nr:MmcQ/YjbR family DNA-binding protein [Bacteroidia bacterium]
MTPEEVRSIALNFEEATEQPHFEKTSFRVRKKIFATMDMTKNQVVIKLSEADQDVFCSHDQSVIFPVPGAWGNKGWTAIKLDKVHPDLFKDAITMSYCGVAPKKLAAFYTNQ